MSNLCSCGMTAAHAHLGTFTVGIAQSRRGLPEEVFLIDEENKLIRPLPFLAAWGGWKVMLVRLDTEP